MQKGEAIICIDCKNRIEGEYYVQKKNGSEEYYHPHCAKRYGKIHLPIQIRFALGLILYKLFHIFELLDIFHYHLS
jgi:hypothetical protein